MDHGQRPSSRGVSDMCAFSYNSILDQRTEGNDKLVPVWYRPAFDQPLKSLEKSVSRNAAMLFSEVWEKQLQSSPNVLVLKGTNMEPYKLILDWVNMCIEEGNDVKFPDVSSIKAQLTSRLHPIFPVAIRRIAFHHSHLSCTAPQLATCLIKKHRSTRMSTSSTCCSMLSPQPTS